jgi:2-methylcitrate dehydratase PrpD
MGSKIMSDSPTKKLVEHIVNANFNDFSDKVIEKAKLLIIDAIGCAIGGKSTEIANIIVDMIRSFGGIPESTIIGFGTKTVCTLASFANSILVNVLDYDDTGAAGHPGSTIIPAALAVAERVNATGKDFLTAVILGYEVCEKIGAAIQPTWKRYVKVHGKSHQTFGAVTAAGKLLGLDKNAMLNAFGLAGAFSPVPHCCKFGLEEHLVAWIKDNVAWMSQAGVFAALLAQKGFIGNHSILDEKNGFWVMAGSDRCDFKKMVNLEEYAILRVSIKPYPCCRWIHTTLEAINTICHKHQLRPQEIKEITVRSIFALADKFVNYEPKTAIDAQFSIPYTVALTIYDVPHFYWYSENTLHNPEILAMAKKVKVEKDPHAQSEYVRRRRIYYADFIPSTVEVLTTTGSKFESHIEFAKGSPQRPLTYDEVKEKFINLTSPLIVSKKQKEILETIEKLETLDSIRELTKLL